MKAPMSERARRIFSDEEAAQKVMNAVRKGESTTVEVEGKTYVVQKASDHRPSEMREGNRGFAWIDGLRGLISKS